MDKSKIFDIGIQNRKYLSKMRVKLGRDIDSYKVLNYDLYRFRGLAIYDERDEKKNIILNRILTELDKFNDKDELEFILVSEKPLATALCSEKSNKFFDIKTNALEFVEYLDNIVKTRKKIFKSKGVNSLYRYNEIADKKLPTILIVIDDYDNYDKSSRQIIDDFIMSTSYFYRGCGFSFIFTTKDFGALSSKIKTILTHEIVFKPKENFKLRGLIYGAYPKITYSNKFYFVSDYDHLATIDMTEILDFEKNDCIIQDSNLTHKLTRSEAMQICNQKGKEFILAFENFYDDIKFYQSDENKKSNEDDIVDKLCQMSINKLGFLYEFVKNIVLTDSEQSILNGDLWNWFFSAGSDFRDFMQNPTYAKVKYYDDFVVNILSGKQIKDCLEIVKMKINVL